MVVVIISRSDDTLVDGGIDPLTVHGLANPLIKFIDSYHLNYG
ncbi:hypothetical protein SAMN05216387_10413 [Nitrosovibrio tenuis]|uniref:Uncharacterized protein n=1 Tax=Nitrosovibrio tenuis TaxID=1233 RepID=A0A1H7LBX3_9PROT|nr:hypothetical protein SAMN05216387_10413 [Nitrosovibrio tenuis]